VGDEMAKGLDCTYNFTQQKAIEFKNEGFSFVCRYLAPNGMSKKLRKSEADNINKAGLYIVSVFETSAGRASGGAANGSYDGKIAYEEAKNLGQPEGSTIYFAVDFEASKSQLNAIEQYLIAAKAEIPGYKIGVYGSYLVVEEMATRGACDNFWQTLAWSYGKKSEHANIYQYDCGRSGLGLPYLGITIDLDESYGNEGWWNALEPQQESEDDETMKLTLNQWRQLGNSLDGLYHKGLINDYTWAEKAYAQNLTAGDIAFLNIIVAAREQGVDTDKNIEW
jgi:hypothetical protein